MLLVGWVCISIYIRMYLERIANGAICLRDEDDKIHNVLMMDIMFIYALPG